MWENINTEILISEERLAEINKKYTGESETLADLIELRRLALKYPYLVSFISDGDNDNQVIEEAIKDAEPNAREPIHFFSSVKKSNNNYISNVRHKTYNDCHAANDLSDWRVAEFREVIPEKEGDYYWVNLYASTEDDEGSVYGFLNDSEALAVKHKSDSLEFVACVKIKGKR